MAQLQPARKATPRKDVDLKPSKRGQCSQLATHSPYLTRFQKGAPESSQKKVRTSRREGSTEKRKISLSPETTVKVPKAEEPPDPLRLLMQKSNSGGLALAHAKRFSLGGRPTTATGLASDHPYNHFSTAVSQTSLRRTQSKGHLESEEARRKRERSSSQKDKPHMFSQKELFRNLKRVRTAEKQLEASRRKNSLR